jgi:prepilin-type N-terminal cleavage/methylation domain-containing protein
MKAENENGFTLIEILVALIVLVMALIPMAGVVTHFLGENLDLERKDRTAFLAQLKMEEAKIKTIAHFLDNHDESATAFPAPDSSFKYTVTLSFILDDKGIPESYDIKLIQVNVWYDGNSNNIVNAGEPSTTLYTKVARRG